MKIESFTHGLSYFFTQRLRRKNPSDIMLEVAKPESEQRRAESIMEDILRWADDGGKMLDISSRTARSNPNTAWERRTKL